MATEAQLAYYKRKSEEMQRRWKDPLYRQNAIEKQKKLGYRTYGTGLFYKTNKTRYGRENT